MVDRARLGLGAGPGPPRAARRGAAARRCAGAACLGRTAARAGRPAGDARQPPRGRGLVPLGRPPPAHRTRMGAGRAAGAQPGASSGATSSNGWPAAPAPGPAMPVAPAAGPPPPPRVTQGVLRGASFAPPRHAIPRRGAGTTPSAAFAGAALHAARADDTPTVRPDFAATCAADWPWSAATAGCWRSIRPSCCCGAFRRTCWRDAIPKKCATSPRARWPTPRPFWTGCARPQPRPRPTWPTNSSTSTAASSSAGHRRCRCPAHPVPWSRAGAT
jgi:hypothetical protein